MEDSKNILPLPKHRLNYGRKRIILDYDEVTPDNVIEVLQKAMNIHAANRSDCDYLIKYFLGDQDILYRQEQSTSNINNKTVVNFAYPVTREIIGYTMGNGIELVAKSTDNQKNVQTLTDAFDYESMYLVDTNSSTLASICGVGYTITLPSSEISKDNTPEIPLVVDFLDPRDTFIVQTSDIGNQQIMSCTILKRQDGKKIYTCYTDKYKMTVENMKTVVVEANPIGVDPIVMTENAIFLTGDWEMAIPVMNASNIVTSDSLNDIEGIIKSLLVITGAEFQDGEEDIKLKKVKENRILTLTAPNGANVDAKFIAPMLDSTSVQNIREYLDDVRNIITGIPDRENNSNGGDTGTAVLNRNGWTDIEIVAKLKEMFIKKAKRKQINIALAILKKLGLVSNDINSIDIDINIGGHNSDNLTARATVFSTLVATKELATIDALQISGLTNRADEVVERGKEAKLKRQEEAIEMAKQAAEASGEGDTTKNGDNQTAEIEKVATNNNNNNE